MKYKGFHYGDYLFSIMWCSCKFFQTCYEVHSLIKSQWNHKIRSASLHCNDNALSKMQTDLTVQSQALTG